MKKAALFVGAVLVHAFLTFYSWAFLFGTAHMRPDEQPKAWQAVFGVIQLLTWQPFLMLLDVYQPRFLSLNSYTLIGLNSVVGVGIIFAFVKVLRSFLRRRKSGAAT